MSRERIQLSFKENFFPPFFVTSAHNYLFFHNFSAFPAGRPARLNPFPRARKKRAVPGK